jgi:hypothetical protein
MTYTAAVDVTHGRPVRARVIRVCHTASNNRIVRVGLQVVIVREDGTNDCCQHVDGHRTRETAVACATKMVARINRALVGAGLATWADDGSVRKVPNA